MEAARLESSDHRHDSSISFLAEIFASRRERKRKKRQARRVPEDIALFHTHRRFLIGDRGCGLMFKFRTRKPRQGKSGYNWLLFYGCWPFFFPCVNWEYSELTVASGGGSTDRLST